jgi:5-methylcytosine-specific restriction endonuclease McrA
MLKSCQYCGRIHDSKFDCGKKPKCFKKYNDKEKFRKTKVWQKKAESIRQRDKNLCQICIRNLYSTVNQYTYNDLSVHHAVPLEADYDKRLDDDNLITTCERHHEMMESGKIPLSEVLVIIREQQYPR